MYSLDTYTSPYILISSDYSQQEPRLTAFVSRDSAMIQAFKDGKDIYATIASLAFHKSYEECLEFHPITGEYQPEGKMRRNSAKTIVLGITYGRSVPSIGQQLYGHDDSMSDEDKTAEAQKVYDSVMRAFPALEKLMKNSQAFARKHGYTETILGRRRHLPDMMLDEFEFEPLPGYVNPNIDPLDISTLNQESGIPKEKIAELKAEFSKYKYFGQIAKRTKELYNNESIRVINNRPKINDAKRQCVNCVDIETEILTLNGWKTVDQINQGDQILSYSLATNKLVLDNIQAINVYDNDEFKVYHLYNAAFDAKATLDHRWVMRNFDTNKVRFYDTSHILKFHRPRYHILRVADYYLENATTDIDISEFKSKFYANELTCSDIFSLTSNQAKSIYDDFKSNESKSGCVDFELEELADKFQILCLIAGHTSNKRKHVTHYKKRDDKVIWKVACSKRELNQTARIDLMKKEEETVNKVWCVTTEQGTWIARRDGKYYITGNSIIQGSAADFTKTALIKVMDDPKWAEIGGEVLTVVHDEIVAQVPLENWEEGATILKQDMESAGSFLPFPIKCDVTATYRWYGLELPCKFKKPDTLDLEDSEVCSWVQWNLVESGYELPVFKDENGNKPIGDAAHGVSGKVSDIMLAAIDDYCNRYNIQKHDFIEDINQRVMYGTSFKEEM